VLALAQAKRMTGCHRTHEGGIGFSRPEQVEAVSGNSDSPPLPPLAGLLQGSLSPGAPPASLVGIGAGLARIRRAGFGEAGVDAFGLTLRFDSPARVRSSIVASGASFLMERFRSLVVLLSFYYLWAALLKNRTSFAGYDHSQMITYVLGMNILRSFVFAGRTDEIAWEINKGLLSGYLLKPVNFVAYTFSRDLSEKSINLVSAIIEVLLLSKFLGVSIAWPHLLAAMICGARQLLPRNDKDDGEGRLCPCCQGSLFFKKQRSFAART